MSVGGANGRGPQRHRWILWTVLSAVFTVGAGFVPMLVPLELLPLTAGIIASVAALLLIAILVISARTRRRERDAEAATARKVAEMIERRGIIQVGTDAARDSDYEQIWLSGAASIVCLGVGMTNVSRGGSVVEAAVRAGTKVTFVMPDAAWLEENPMACAEMVKFYETSALLLQISESARLLERLAEKFEAAGHPGRVKIVKYRALMSISATIADWDGDMPHGCYEMHLFGNARSRVRFRLDRLQRTEIEPPVAFKVIDSIHLLIETEARGATDDRRDAA